jgi:hypothetical protein
MLEDNNNLNADTTNPTPFEDFVRQQLVAIAAQVNSLRGEMVERFVQLSRQMRDLDQKVNVFIREQTYIKDDIRELREEKLTKI